MEMVVNVNVCACAVNTWTMYRYIHKYSDFLVAMISVGLTQACPNYSVIITEILPIVIFADRSLRRYSLYMHMYICLGRCPRVNVLVCRMSGGLMTLAYMVRRKYFPFA